MRDRLIELLEEAKTQALATIGSMNHGFGEWYADYLLANGVIVPPCKVGDVVYVGVKGTSRVFGTKVLAIGFDEDGDLVLNPYEYPDDVFCVNGANIGKTVFLTREEAERALKGGAE